MSKPGLWPMVARTFVISLAVLSLVAFVTAMVTDRMGDLVLATVEIAIARALVSFGWNREAHHG